ncbi:MAG TPA: response regulator [Holophagaceae bacterium]|nr:response regulator [Holophagaceae bacterium]
MSAGGESLGRILCIEDNPMNWRLVQRLLGQAGFDMHWAEEGMRGFELAMELKPDLVLLDINLPGLSGFEVATKLRQQRDLDATLIVALTAKTMRSDRETALVTGCDGFISKPIDPFHFVEQVKGYLAGRRDRIEQGREGAALRQFSQQVVEHLEAQLKEAQESNRRLTEAQRELEARNRNLSSLFNLSQTMVGEHEPERIFERVLDQAQRELGLQQIAAYRVHDSGGYMEGRSWDARGTRALPVLGVDHPIVARLQGLPWDQAFGDDDLNHSPLWEPGLELGWWTHRSQGLVLPLASRTGVPGLWGLLAASRESGPFQAHERELMGLYGGILQVSASNASLISTLNQAHQALAESYERVETSLGELQKVQHAAGQRSRNVAVGDLLNALAARMLTDLDALASGGDPAAGTRVASLIKAVLRRGGQVGSAMPEHLDLHALLPQEIEILRVLGTLPVGLDVTFKLEAASARLFGVPSDFTEVIGYLVQNAMEGMPPARTLVVRSEGDGHRLSLTFEDDGAAISPALQAVAFEPFSGLSETALTEGRLPAPGLAACAQLMGAYEGRMSLESGPGRTIVRLDLPLEA